MCSLRLSAFSRILRRSANGNTEMSLPFKSRRHEKEI